MSAPVTALPDSLRKTFIQGLSSVLLGAFIVAVLEGVLLQSLFIYFRFYPKDPRFLKVWVVAIVILQTVCCAMIMHTTFFYLVSNYFNPIVIISGAVISSKLLPIFGPITNLLVQCFFARRALILGHQYHYTVYFAMLLNFAACGFFFALAAQAFQINNLERSTHFGGWIITTASSLMLAGDIQLTAVLITALHKSRTGIKRTNSMVDVLITYSVSTGFLLCLFNATAVGLSVAFPTGTLFLAFLYISQQVNANSVLIALNTRTLIMSVGEIEETEINPFRSRVVQVNREAKDDSRQFELPSIMFAPVHTSTIHSTTEAETKDERGVSSGLLDDNDHPNGSHTMVGV
ncbi:hypothetical protein C8Q74DRAFT_1374120 [Fomes fomentarius]|nr:hypothetical protein C8Q74DRAFT_1374120 [Fomes fomentarius]